MRWHELAVQAIDRYFIQPRFADRSEDERRRARLVVGFALALALCCPVYGAVYLWLGSPHAVLAVTVALPIGLLTCWFVRWFGSATFAGSWLAVVLAGTLAWISYFNGGYASPATQWFAALPLVAMYYGGKRFGYLFGAAAAAVCCLPFFLLARAGHRLPLEVGAGNLPALTLVAQLGLIFVVLALAHIYESQRLGAAAEMEGANDELRSSNRRLEESMALLHRTETALLEHTAALETANQALLSEMKERQAVEVELRLAHKLEAVGRLASGIAHEINTPVQFVSDSVHFVRDSVMSMGSLLEKYVSLCESVRQGAPSPAAAEEAAAAASAADLPYLVENIPQALDLSLEGLDRIAVIVRSMKAFAHPDRTNMTPADLNAGVLNTLTIARSEYKLVAEVETDLGAIPAVVCFPGEINQALLNIIVNAAHAIGEAVAGTGELGRITIRTRHEDDEVVIAIADTGGGIPPEIRERVFDPFFTTKDVGRGSGQGLAIARSVIQDKHAGRLGFESEVGTGTTFYIRLPIDGGGRAAEAVAA